MVVEMTQNNNLNDKFKEQRETKIVENEHISKNAVSQICCGSFLANVGHISHNVFIIIIIIIIIIDLELVHIRWEG